MSDESKQLILSIVVNTETAQKNLQQAEKNILSLKNAQKDLNKEYKEGKITEDAYVQTKIKLDKQLKSESETRRSLQRSIAAENNSMNAQKALLSDLTKQRDKMDRSNKDNVESFNKLNERIKELNTSLGEAEEKGGNFHRNVGNYPEALGKFAEGVKIGEFELGGFAKTVEGLISPTGALAAGVSALGAAYASSAGGAKDLEEAQNYLKSQWKVMSGYIGGEASGEEGILTKGMKGLFKVSTLISESTTGFLAPFIDNYVQKIGNEAEKVSGAYGKIKEFQFEQLKNEVESSKQRREAYQLTLMRDNIEENIFKRQEAAQKIVELLKKSQEDNVESLKKQLEQIEKIGSLTHDDVHNENSVSDLRKQYLSLLVQINEAEASREKKIAAAALSEQKITQELKKQQSQKPQEGFSFDPNKNTSDPGTFSKKEIAEMAKFDDESKKADAQNLKDEIASQNEAFEFFKGYLDKKYAALDDYHKKSSEIKDDYNKNEMASNNALLQSSQDISRAGSALLKKGTDEYKLLQTSSAMVSTYAAANRALNSQYGNFPPANIIAAAAVIAEGLANVAHINAAAGGGSFETKGPTMLLVGDNPGGVERIDVTPVSGRGQTKVKGNSIAMAGGGSLTMVNDGLFTNNSTKDTNNAVMMSNFIKNAPTPVVSWREGLIVDSRIKFKESLTSK